jgi:hypothetical protein
MKAEHPYVKLFQLILPEDIALFFDLVDVREEAVTDRRELHLYLDEKPVVPTGYKSTDLSPNGFYESGSIQDFPIRDRRVDLHVRRRRWLDNSTDKSVSKDWDLVARGTPPLERVCGFFKRVAWRNTRLRPALLSVFFMSGGMSLSVNTKNIRVVIGVGINSPMLRNGFFSRKTPARIRAWTGHLFPTVNFTQF